MLILLPDRKAALVEVARRERQVSPGLACRFGGRQRADMKESTKSSELSVGEILWALVTIGSMIALFQCLAR